MKKGVDYIGVGVGAAIFNKKGEVLLALRGEKAKNERGKWEIPGGGVEFNETFEQTIQREMKEELDIDIVVKELLDVCSHIIADEKQHWVSPTYICTITKGLPRIVEPEKCADLQWFSIEEMGTLPLSLVTKHDLQALKKKYPKGITQ